MIKKVLICGAVLWIALLATMLAVTLRKPAETPEDAQTMVEKNPSSSDLKDGQVYQGDPIDMANILGNWISDRTDENTMTLKEDGTFKDTDLMGEGTFETRGSYLILTNATGNGYVMLYRPDMDAFYYTIDKYVSVYRRATDEEAAEKIAKVEQRLTAQEEQANECLKEARERIINTSWGSGRDYIAFKSHTFVWSEGESKQEYKFDIIGASYIEGDPAGYEIELAVTTLDGEAQECRDFMLLFGNEEIPPSIEMTLNGEKIVLQDTYQSSGSIDWDEPVEAAEENSEDEDESEQDAGSDGEAREENEE